MCATVNINRWLSVKSIMHAQQKHQKDPSDEERINNNQGYFTQLAIHALNIIIQSSTKEDKNCGQNFIMNSCNYVKSTINI